MGTFKRGDIVQSTNSSGFNGIVMRVVSVDGARYLCYDGGDERWIRGEYLAPATTAQRVGWWMRRRGLLQHPVTAPIHATGTWLRTPVGTAHVVGGYPSPQGRVYRVRTAAGAEYEFTERDGLRRVRWWERRK